MMSMDQPARRRGTGAAMAVMVAALAMVATGAAPAGAQAPGATAADHQRALDLVRKSVKAMGGETVLRSVDAVEIEAVGNRNMLEQSERPEGPWFQDYYQLHEIRDLAGGQLRVTSADRGYSSPDWWLQSTSWTPTTFVVTGGASALEQDGKFVRYSSATVQDAEEDLALGPERLLLTALAAPDLTVAADSNLHGFTHHVVAWTWSGAPVRVFLNGYTALPTAIELRRPRPYDVFWNVWGDITTRTVWSTWSLEPGGLRYPRQWTVERNGLPDSSLTITSVVLNPRLKPAEFAVPAEVRDASIKGRHTIDEIPLGSPQQPATDLAPGVVHIPGSWNVTLIAQSDGVLVLEGPISSGYSVKVLAEAARRFPALPVKGVITTSDSWPHIGGLREYVAHGIPVYALDLDRPILQRLSAASHTARPDELARHPRAADLRLVAAATAVGDGANRVVLYPYRSQTGERQMIVYFPATQLLYTSDLFAPAGDAAWFTPEYLAEAVAAVEREHLAVRTVFGMHYGLTPWQDIRAALAKAVAAPAGTAAASKRL